MPNRGRGDSGKWRTKLTGEDILTVFDEDCPHGMQSLQARHIRDGLDDRGIDLDPETVCRQLNSMADDGVLVSGGQGTSAKWWTLVDGDKTEK